MSSVACRIVLAPFRVPGSTRLPRAPREGCYCHYTATQQISMFSWRSTCDTLRFSVPWRSACVTTNFCVFMTEHGHHDKLHVFITEHVRFDKFPCFHGGARAFSAFLAEHVRYNKFQCIRGGECALSQNKLEPLIHEASVEFVV